jgi:uncharacterized protein YxjI
MSPAGFADSVGGDTRRPAPRSLQAAGPSVGAQTEQFRNRRSTQEERMYLIRERLFRLGEHSEITDESGRIVLHVDGTLLSLRNRLVIRDPAGNEVAQVHRRLATLRPTYQISIGGETAAEVRKHLFTPFGDRFTIDVPGPDDLEMQGDLLDHEFAIVQRGRVAATVSRRWVSLHDTYAVDVAEGGDHLLILASVLALDLAEEQERAQR